MAAPQRTAAGLQALVNGSNGALSQLGHGHGVVPDSYLVMFKPDTSAAEIDRVAELVTNAGGQVTSRFGITGPGLAVRIPRDQLHTLSGIEAVASVQPNRIVPQPTPVAPKLEDR
ncbi:hypothetical protein BC828DRAFT_405553 [Blastocladiella britannica]|nr:hypothetical protein BC828DRAFT_405553 [Blastocladiella britannica]